MALPKIDYLSRDYDGLRASMLQYAQAVFPDWQPASEGDFGLMMLELQAYMGDILSYYTDRAQFENYLGTATQRDSVLGLAYLLGYIPNSGSPATGTVTLVTSVGVADVTVPAGTQITTGRIAALDAPVTFETNASVVIPGNAATPTVVAVTEGTTETYAKIGESTGQPAQTLVLPNTGVYRSTIRLFIEDSSGSTVFNSGVAQVTAREWLQVDHLLDSMATDTAFEVQYVDDAAVINFGDDVNGAIPATGLQVFATYRHGVGAQGNVAAGQVRLINDKTLAGLQVYRVSDGTYQSSAMTGGADPESTDSIRYNAPRAYRTQNRVVTTKDFRDLALGVEGVSKANVVAGSFTSVTIYVAGADGGVPSAALKTNVANAVQGKTLAGVDVTVAPATSVGLNIGTATSPVTVELYPQYSQTSAKLAIEVAIRNRVGRMVTGERMTVHKIYEAITGVEGVRYVDIPVMVRSDVTQPGAGVTAVTGITPREWEIFSVNSTNITLTGGLT